MQNVFFSTIHLTCWHIACIELLQLSFTCNYCEINEACQVIKEVVIKLVELSGLLLAEVQRVCWKYRHYLHKDFLVLDRLSLISPHHTQPVVVNLS